MSERVPRRRQFAVSYGRQADMGTTGWQQNGELVQPIEYRDGWIIPPEWEFMNQKWTYTRKPVQETFCVEDVWIGAARNVGYHIFVDLVINGI